MWMQSWQVRAAGAPLVAVEHPAPVPVGTEVLVEVSHCGVCHSDVTLWQGRFDMGDGPVPISAFGFAHPLTLGHEIVGRVVAHGPKAEGVPIGARRIVYPWVGCGTCAACRAEADNQCQTPSGIGTRRRGGFGSHVIVPHPRHMIDPGDLDPALAATLACSGLTAYAAVQKLMPLDADVPVVVIGAGGVGLSAIAVLRALGHRAIVAVDRAAEKLALARDAGASATLDSTWGDVAGQIKAACGGLTLNILDFVNNGDTATLALASLGKGGRLVMVGMYGGALSLPLMKMPMMGLTIMGSYVGSPAELRALVALSQSGRLAPIPIEPVPRAAINTALPRLAQGLVAGRIVLTDERA
jgi:alcohol dehydrogenase, propanol-preferring